ncbi:Mastermind-Like Domain-Containing Protein 1 [Manis pentadactyla]|nr:Mastermind-Like Domain-Containing Protein 1 [Manis pentadactyla]
MTEEIHDQTEGQALDHNSVLTVIFPEASQERLSTPFPLVCQLEREGSLLTDVLCGPRSTTDTGICGTTINSIFPKMRDLLLRGLFSAARSNIGAVWLLADTTNREVQGSVARGQEQKHFQYMRINDADCWV